MAIVGLGVRGLSALERILAAARTQPDGDITLVDIFDTGYNISYQADQPDYLLLNIMCGQTSAFPDASSVSAFPPSDGPSLFEWAAKRGMSIQQDGMTVTSGNESPNILPESFLPRRVFGEYLAWSFDYLCRTAPDGVEIRRHLESVSAIEPNGHSLKVSGSAGVIVNADFVFLTAGMIRPLGSAQSASGDAPNRTGNSNERHIVQAFPLPQSVEEIRPGASVAVAGLGLTFIDAVAALTVGRGGEFRRSGRNVSYIRSGAEPNIVAFSRSGSPYRTRPRRASAMRRHEPIYFTRQRIEALTAQAGYGCLDFDNDILPWLFLEMQALHAERSGLLEITDATRSVALACSSIEDARHTLQVSIGREQLLDARALYFGQLAANDGRFADSSVYQALVVDFIERDLAFSWRGVDASPTKAALELCRDLRDVIRFSVDFGRLSESSGSRFFNTHRTLIDRVVVGPQADRHADLLALVRSGVVRMPVGPSPKVSRDGDTWLVESTMLETPAKLTAEWLVEAHATPVATEPGPALFERLFASGLCGASTIYRNTGSIALNDRMHPLRSDGRAVENVWVLGLATEGTTYYNNYVMSPAKFVRGFWDADQAVLEMMLKVRNQSYWKQDLS